MIIRYSTKRMQAIWSLQNKFQTYLEIEFATLRAWNKLGLIPTKDLNEILKNSKINLSEIDKLENDTKHDVIAFTRSISALLGLEKKWFHYGLTSTDIVDTAYAVQLKEADGYILENLLAFAAVLKAKAMLYKKTPIIGRTHGIHAEITSFGLKWALWYDELQRDINRFKLAAKEIEVGKISGAVGNFANTGIELQDMVCKELKLGSAHISTQILQRDRHAAYIFSLAVIASTLEKIAMEIRHLSRTEVHEVEENFAKNQKGSSAMPHKKNPIASENICGLARVIRGYNVTALENIPLWHERDISHSSAERIILPDATNLIDYMLTRYGKVLDELNVFPDKMLENIDLTNGIIYSQRVLLVLINKGVSREAAYDKIQALTTKKISKKNDFKKIVLNDEFIAAKLTKKQIESCFDPQYFLKEVDAIYKRVFNAQIFHSKSSK